MKAFVLALIAIAIIGTGAAYVLENFQTSSDTAFSGIGTRIEKHDVAHGAKPKG